MNVGKLGTRDLWQLSHPCFQGNQIFLHVYLLLLLCFQLFELVMLCFPKPLNSDQNEFPYTQLCKHNLIVPIILSFQMALVENSTTWRDGLQFFNNCIKLITSSIKGCLRGSGWFLLNFLSLACKILSYASDYAATKQIQALKAHRHACSFQDLFFPTC